MDEKVVNFGPFRLDLDRRELSRAGVAIELGDRALSVLCVLASAKGEVVTKDELLRRVWPGLIVAESNIQVQVEGDQATVRFRQTYSSATLNTASNKSIVLVQRGNRWLIQQERVGR